MRLGDLVTGGPGDVAVEDGDVVGVDAQQLQSGVAVTGDVGRDRFQAQPIADGLRHVGLVLDDQHTHALNATSRRISSAYRKPHTCWQHHAALTGSMSRTAAARTTTRRTLRPTAVGLVVVTAAIIGTLVHQSASSSAPSFSEVLARRTDGATADGRRCRHRGDGVLPDGVTVFDDEYPGVANLDPDLLQALREAATDAADDGIEFYVNSGWRSPEYQDQLLREAVSEYGSEEEAARWVATADTSRSRVRGRGRHRVLRCHGVAVGARRRVRAVPDLRQRALALRTAPRGDRSWLPAHVCRPHARSEDAAVTGAVGRSRPGPGDFRPPTCGSVKPGHT